MDHNIQAYVNAFEEGKSLRTICQEFQISDLVLIQALAHKPEITLLGKDYVKPLLAQLPSIGTVMTITEHLGSVFEFKGSFPSGTEGHGYHNLNLHGDGFGGHININNISHIAVVTETMKNNRQSLSWWFIHETGQVVFKVFVGRDADGELKHEQVTILNQWHQKK
ncbi:heme utilization cystosolic carrier protein HutX [Neisseria sp. Ec49-e6-T10]|uniref:heme utilization cystosolic carrier protein HutX n=1 Tax=Neisseria sp. Ec49-e6-T10 TaxID=3140744 RepID=UPI003EBF3BE0